ncbi:MAG: metallophosphoesterase [Phycisphaerales bacterium]|jgi:hypothetical protein|nr:metallophosphoesterase [Phycisphaerales bacterium]MDP6310865.1 metallophosphoesterase [Phycisphaerales bacterium]MDP7086165.1 metallophosphoesterase [Phycisphaerales bacterium]MDP7189502.1 metallophosphoesterase [Phycisphaerales bacterium]MDP7519914.1 metallophosphoesterase [Phycisphaerales bacterium]|tara:strand:- start:563 stop:1450 length:888 start_codon:yes stop_codon:yes gene_type:complete
MSPPSDWTQADRLIAIFEQATSILLSTPGRIGSRVDLPNEGSLMIAGDLHDHLPNYMRILAAAQLENKQNHLLLQELIHGPTLIHDCDMSWRMLARVAELLVQHPGRVHPILGNHENSQLTRVGVTKGGGNSIELFEDGVALTFGEDWERVYAAIDGFLAAMPLAVRTASGVQCTHSLPDAVLMGRFDPMILEREPTPDDRLGPDGAAYLLTWGRRFDGEQITELLRAWSIRCMVIGHIRLDGGVRRVSDSVMALASDQDDGAVLELDLSTNPDIDDMMARATPIQVLPTCEPAS